MQLDLFADSRDVLLRNDAVVALRSHDAAAVRKAWDKLHVEYPDDRLLAPMAVLLEALNTSFKNLNSVEAANEALALMEKYAAAAGKIFDPELANLWLVPLWRSIAEGVSRMPFSVERPLLHRAAMLLRAHDWEAAEVAIVSIAAWRRIPQTLVWMIEARRVQSGLSAAWPLLVELAWLAPARFRTLVQSLHAPVLIKLLRQFDSEYEADLNTNDPTDAVNDSVWFPAWVLLVEPSLTPLLRQVEATRGLPPERAFQLVLQLLDCERQGRQASLVDLRKKLRDLNRAIFNCYMKTR